MSRFGTPLKTVELDDDDKKAKKLIVESLFVCAHDRTLSRKLMNRFPAALGRKLVIVGDWFNLSELTEYDYTVFPPAGLDVTGERPVERVVAFVRQYLQAAESGVVVSENWGAERKHIDKWLWPPPRVACFGDKEVYHILTPDITDPEMIEAAVATRHQWQTNVCSACANVPEGDVPDEAFLNEIVQNTKHIFMPAFDGSGYIIWSPA